MHTPLFSEFEALSSKAWKQQIQAELRGADFNETLVTHTENGIDIKPFYHPDEVESYTQLETPSWKICQSFAWQHGTSPSPILDAVERGAESILLRVDSTSVPIAELLGLLNQKGVQPYIAFGQVHSKELNLLFQQHFSEARFLLDPIAHFGKTGNWLMEQKKDFELLQNLAKEKGLHLTLQTKHYQQAGATHVQQIAYAMAHLHEYLHHASHNNYLSSIASLHVEVAIGGNYFFEIAKLRALRIALYTLLAEYQLDIPICIFAEPSIRNKTIFDYNVNMLRTTTECMSAILGGADVVCNLNYDAIYQKENEFANRISRNQLLILKSESYFDKVNNPADGSYYIEKLTQQLQEKALLIFQDIEKGGGLIQQLFQGKIQKKVKEQDRKEREALQLGNKKLVGTNAYQNSDEKWSSPFEIRPFSQKKSRKTLIEPFSEKRLAEEIELQRIKSSK